MNCLLLLWSSLLSLISHYQTVWENAIDAVSPFIAKQAEEFLPVRSWKELTTLSSPFSPDLSSDPLLQQSIQPQATKLITTPERTPSAPATARSFLHYPPMDGMHFSPNKLYPKDPLCFPPRPACFEPNHTSTDSASGSPTNGTASAVLQEFTDFLKYSGLAKYTEGLNTTAASSEGSNPSSPDDLLPSSCPYQPMSFLSSANDAWRFDHSFFKIFPTGHQDPGRLIGHPSHPLGPFRLSPWGSFFSADPEYLAKCIGPRCVWHTMYGFPECRRRSTQQQQLNPNHVKGLHSRLSRRHPLEKPGTDLPAWHEVKPSTNLSASFCTDDYTCQEKCYNDVQGRVKQAQKSGELNRIVLGLIIGSFFTVFCVLVLSSIQPRRGGPAAPAIQFLGKYERRFFLIFFAGICYKYYPIPQNIVSYIGKAGQIPNHIYQALTRRWTLRVRSAEVNSPSTDSPKPCSGPFVSTLSESSRGSSARSQMASSPPSIPARLPRLATSSATYNFEKGGASQSPGSSRFESSSVLSRPQTPVNIPDAHTSDVREELERAEQGSASPGPDPRESRWATKDLDGSA